MNRAFAALILKQVARHSYEMEQYVTGAEIQSKRVDDNNWYDTHDPSFQTDMEYRVKPKEPRVVYLSENYLRFSSQPGLDLPRKFIEVIE